MEYTYEDARPDVDSTAHICAEATLVGDVSVGPHASIWPGAVLRGDFGSVVVGAHSHVEEHGVLHDGHIGEEVLVGHGAVINGATVGDEVIVGINATLNADVVLEGRSIVAPNAVVPQGREIPSESLVRGVPAEVTPIGELGKSVEELLSAYSARRYSELAEDHTDLFAAEH